MRAPPCLTAAVAGAAVAVAATTAAAVSGKAGSGERAMARAAYDLPTWSTGLLRVLMQAGTRAAVVVVFVALLVAGRRRAAAMAGLSGAVAWLMARALKEIVDRPRPSAASLGRPLREFVEGPGYPSTHAAIAAALAVALVLAVPLPRVVAVAVAALAVSTAVARVHLGVHWPLDVVGALGIGTAVAGTAAAVDRRRLQRGPVARR